MRTTDERYMSKRNIAEAYKTLTLAFIESNSIVPGSKIEILRSWDAGENLSLIHI